MHDQKVDFDLYEKLYLHTPQHQTLDFGLLLLVKNVLLTSAGSRSVSGLDVPKQQSDQAGKMPKCVCYSFLPKIATKNGLAGLFQNHLQGGLELLSTRHITAQLVVPNLRLMLPLGNSMRQGCV